MSDRPILFSAPMVRALLAGTKTQTRRVLKPQPARKIIPCHFSDTGWANATADELGCTCEPFPSPRFAVGDRLWVKESWWIATRYSYGTTPGGDELPPPQLAYRRGDPVHYAADGNPPNCANRHYGPDGLRGRMFAAPDPYAVWHRKVSIHMPRWASRLTLTVTDVRVERLQDISRDDAIAEGLTHKAGVIEPDWWMLPEPLHQGRWLSPVAAYRFLWNEINGPGAWDANPWVVAVSFEVRKGKIDA
ncbi:MULTISPECIES: hypothetical protein [Sphingomonadales]|uniref:hypothetical protein n=1 Tax=Sphingomonadales TaxID=204457 RepID=UPI000826D335|nr:MULTISPECIES: hypothetical protein [Sphingomonadales]MCH2238771.1 hypothetical protein [Blastomonas sp.]